MKRIATWTECYTALRYNRLDVVASVFYATVMWLRETTIEEES